MQIQFQSRYLSISEFEPVEFPVFTILTGVNGSGKSHLLEAIANGNVSVAGPYQKIILFSYETFRLDNEADWNAFGIAAERETAWNFFSSYLKGQIELHRKEQLGPDATALELDALTNRKPLWNLNSPRVQNYRQRISELFSSSEHVNNPHSQAILSLAKQLPYSVDLIERHIFNSLYKPFTFKNDFLPSQLGKVFWDYYVKLRTNQMHRYENEVNGAEYEYLTEVDFFRTHGPKPWDVVNNILGTFETLHYRVNSPEGADYFGSYRLRLAHTEKEGVEIEFSSLSSGEKVLMALVASTYKSSSDSHFPDILLLDEIDASLHPSMIRNLLEIIQTTFLDNSVQVLFVTHSPTTVALSPENSVFVMQSSGLNRIEKKSRQEALAILTQGFATLEEGLKLFDQVARSPITIITEGFNTNYIAKALELFGVTTVEVLTGVEGASGKNQLKTLFDFFSKVPHDNKVIFVWDCDVNWQCTGGQATYPFIFERNHENQIAKKGIENLFPDNLFDGYSKTITRANGEATREFDSSEKREFEEFILTRNNIDDFSKFKSLIAEIERIRKL